jgi:hypothetical protein
MNANQFTKPHHTEYYEQYGWKFFGMEESEFGGKTRVYEMNTPENVVEETEHELYSRQ